MDIKKVKKKKVGREVKVRPSLEPGSMDAHPGNSKLARALGSPDFHTREKAVAAMTRFLLRKPDIEEKDMLKIWKGLFYAFWHSDKTPVQVSAATEAAFVAAAVPKFLTAFFL